jgi:CHAD domain-containing protein
MSEGKWITGLTPDLSLPEAARLVLPKRLQVVVTHLPPALASAGKDPEHVHQLRVATRRATAALRLFEDCLPRKHERILRRSLQALRRTAGAARDWDVFFEMLVKAPALHPASAKAARDFLLGFQAARRCEAQTQLTAVASEECEKLERETKKLDDKTFEWRDASELTAGALAVERIGTLMEELERAAAPPPAGYEELHRLRILCKRLRYSMEVFAECFEPPLRERLYPAIEEMQEILGRITDAHIAVARFIEIRDYVKSFQPSNSSRYRKPIEQLLQAQRRVMPVERKRFLVWLKTWNRLAAEHALESLLRK